MQCSGPASTVRILDDHSHEPDQGALPEEALPERGAVPLCEGGAVSPASHSGSGTGAPDRSLLDEREAAISCQEKNNQEGKGRVTEPEKKDHDGGHGEHSFNASGWRVVLLQHADAAFCSPC